ncbi:hypothetical protein GBAR_LOCUS27814 [Geodia barretti]|uniref:Uncharacterized protein n=1 Tax=Geodia barretti TaxID=519541 RepID=A0AA35TN81_GEOBA|nr:hypothetical protein GBAR_LOCUS27814 [Geodia barretti]
MCFPVTVSPLVTYNDCWHTSPSIPYVQVNISETGTTTQTQHTL